MNEMQLKVFATMIAAAMKSGNMEKVTEIYHIVSEKGTMEDAAKLEDMIAALMN
ncbi:MAG: hypothetical protein LBI19_00175 [Oscillospiraceae bacterium]|jgi:pentatricopeptide repeat protein|nr:hypothetical protein [Oscillospiraceae bacterium]